MEAPTSLYSSLLLLVLGLSSLGCFFFLYTIKKKNRKCGSSSVSVMESVKNRHRMLDWSTEVIAASPTHTVTFNLGPGAVLTANPSNVEHILKTNFQNYQKGPTVVGTFQDLLGLGIINCDSNPHWELQRNLIVHEFTTKSFRALEADVALSGAVNKLLPLLSSKSKSGTVFDLQAVLERFAFDGSCKIAFGIDDDSREEGYEEFLRSYESAARLIVKRYGQPRFFRKLASLFGRGIETALKAELAILNGFITNVIRDRKQLTPGAETGTDLLSRFVAAGEYPDELLRDMMINLMAAGRDTTSSAMSWFFWLVSSEPAVRERIRQEIRSVREKHGTGEEEALTLEEVRDMTYLHAAVSEALRLYPPVPIDARVAVTADVLPDGTEAGKGTAVMHSPYAMGRMESIWGADCREFVPERWLDGDGKFVPRSPYQYPVFHAGPRTCVGKQMAYDQIKGVVGSIMEKFEVEMAEEGEREQETLMIVLRMKKGLPVTVTPVR